MDRTFKDIGKRIYSKRESASFCFRRHFFLFQVRTQAKTAQFRGKSKLETVLKIKRYEQRLTQGYSVYGGSGLWAPGLWAPADINYAGCPEGSPC